MRTTPTLTRRRFIAAGAGAASALVMAGFGAARRSQAAVRNPLFVPPTLSGSEAGLRADQAVIDLGGGATTPVLAYEGSMPGPTFVLDRGDAAGIDVVNGLAEETTVHWHGMVVPTVADGQPQDPIVPGGTRRYTFDVVQRAALNWYHPHPHMHTASQVAYGLAGAFIVRDPEEAALGLPAGAREVPLVIRDASFDAQGRLRYRPRSSGFLGKLPLVNGTLDPVLTVDTAIYRFRVLNGANGRVFRLALGDGRPMVLIGNDGGLLAAARAVTSITIAPGERLDLLVDLRSLPVGTSLMLRDLSSGWDLLELAVTRAVAPAGSIPTSLSTISKLPAPVRTRTFSFDGMSRINGLEFDPDRIDLVVPFGQTERWRFSTGGNAPHPVHVHGASFQVERRTGGRGRVYPWERGWKDTVLLLDGETVDVKIRFDRFRGRYLMHCHKLEHEDAGMMLNFEVV